MKVFLISGSSGLSQKQALEFSSKVSGVTSSFARIILISETLITTKTM